MKWIFPIITGIVLVLLVSGCTQTGEMTGKAGESDTTQNLPERTESSEPTQPPAQEVQCAPDWQCGEWSECTPAGIQTRTCTDVNSCGTTSGKPTESQSCDYEFLVTKSPEEILPTREEIPTEFVMGEIDDIELSEIPSGFESGKLLSIYKTVGRFVIGVVLVDFDVYKFSTISDAEAFYTEKVGNIKNTGGYTEASIPVSSGTTCFSWTEDYGFEASFAGANCQKANVYYLVVVTTTETYEKPYKYLSNMVFLVDNKIN